MKGGGDGYRATKEGHRLRWAPAEMGTGWALAEMSNGLGWVHMVHKRSAGFLSLSYSSFIFPRAIASPLAVTILTGLGGGLT